MEQKNIDMMETYQAAGPWMRSTAVEPEGLGVGHLTYDIARLRPSLSMTSMS